MPTVLPSNDDQGEQEEGTGSPEVDKADDTTPESTSTPSEPVAPAPSPAAVSAEPKPAAGRKDFLMRLDAELHERLRQAAHDRREPMKEIAQRGLVAELVRLGY